MGIKPSSANVHDVAAYLLTKTGPISAMKFQKLVYYCQAWSLVWDDRPLFTEPIQAWANGPVIYDLYQIHRNEFLVTRWPSGDPEKLDQEARETIDGVVKFYGGKSAQWLSDLTHKETPWLKNRKNLAPGTPGDREITLSDMAEYYGSL